METILNYLNQGELIMHDVIIVMSQWKWTWLWYYAWRHAQSSNATNFGHCPHGPRSHAISNFNIYVSLRWRHNQYSTTVRYGPEWDPLQYIVQQSL